MEIKVQEETIEEEKVKLVQLARIFRNQSYKGYVLAC